MSARSEKVTRLLESGRVVPEPSNGLQLLTVEGDSGRYRVVIGPTFTSCTCKGWRETMRRCTHIDAAVELAYATEAERKLWLGATARRVHAEQKRGGELIDALNG